MAQISITVNGKVRKAHVEPRLLLVHFLREQLHLTGTHVGCDTSQCGACTVLVDGRSAKSCTIFAVQADGSTVTTIEGLAKDGQLHPLQEGFWEEHGLQCGYCTPGMIMSAVNLLNDNPKPSEQRNPRGHRRQLLPLHRLPAHRQRHPARREQSRARCRLPTSGGTMAAPVLPKLVGQRVKRREDPRLIQGRGTYVDDIKIAGMQHLAFKRSDVAHGRIRSIDTSAAEAMDGVEAVFTGAQIAELLAPMPIGTPFPSPPHRAVAVDVVRYAGEPVAVVVARDRYLARDAADAIVVEYEPLPAVVDPELAMTGKPTVIHAGLPEQPRRRRSCRAARASARMARRSTIPPSTRRFAEAEVVISQRMVNHRLVPNAMEPRGVVAHYEPGKESMTIWSSTQNPHILKTMIAAMTRPGRGPGARDRAGGRRRLRRQDQHLRRGVRRRGHLEAARHRRSSGSRSARKRSWRPRMGATSSATSILPQGATARSSA